jgi:hypothetical protein
MPKELFVGRAFSAASLLIVDQANDILTEYRAQGFVLTLRQLYYQFVARGLIPNKQREYNRLGNIVSDARLAGLIDWQMIEDRTRKLESLPNWSDPSELIEICAEQFRTDIWEHQPVRPEVWIEKDALAGVVEPVCKDLRVPYFACRGYSSQSEQWRAGRRFRDYLHAGQKVLVLHFGDHDPSGIDMTRDNLERLTMFALGNVEVRRMALNMDQVEHYNPPPNPAKSTDSRFASYVERYGDESWELDALEPAVIANLIRNEVESIRDDAAWETVIENEDRERDVLHRIVDRWNDLDGLL